MNSGSDQGNNDATSRIELAMRIQRFHLPPVESALVIGKSSGIGPNAMSKALTEMMPGSFTMIQVDHPVAEAVIVRTAHLRTVPTDKLVAVLLERCEPLMDPSDMIHVNLDIVVHATTEIAL